MSEQTARNFNLENLIRDCKHYLKESGHLQRDKIITWAESLEKLGKTPIHLICGQIRDEARREFGWSDGQLRYINEVLSGPNYDKFKDHSNDNKGEPERCDDTALEILTTLDRLDEDEILNNFNEDVERQIHEKIIAAKNKIESHATKNHRTLVDHPTDDDDEKISTPKITPGKHEPYYAQADLCEAVDEYSGRNHDMLDLMYNDPPNAASKEEQREIANKIRDLTQFFIGMNKLLKSCTDRKHSFSMWKHAEMQVVDETGFKHQAGKKMAVPIIGKDGKLVIDPKTGKPKLRYITRERVGDSRESTFKWMKQMSKGMESFAVWFAYIKYRDEATDLNNRIAWRKDELHDKLSESSM